MQRLLRSVPQLQRSTRRASQSESFYLSIDDVVRQDADVRRQKESLHDRQMSKTIIIKASSDIASMDIRDEANKTVPSQIAKVRPTYLLGAYDLLGRIWDAVLQSLMVICVGILPYAIGVVLFPDIVATMTTCPLNVMLLPLSMAMTTIGAFATQAMRCELWKRLTTPRARTRHKYNNSRPRTSKA